jgi:hypothetical protein
MNRLRAWIDEALDTLLGIRCPICGRRGWCDYWCVNRGGRDLG